jgi:hypothetical protein
VNRAEWEAMRADRARTQYSNRSLAKSRRDRPKDLVALLQEQESYTMRFRSPPTDPSPTKIVVISDVNGNYPDMIWTRPDR